MRGKTRRSAAAGACLGIVVLMLFSASAAAVTIKGGDGSGNTAPPDSPALFPYWDALGQISNASDSPPGDEHPWDGGGTAIYLGNGYCMTAYHIRVLDSPVSVTFGETTYGIAADSWRRFEDDGTGVDLVVFRTSGAFPDIPAIPYDSIPTAWLSTGETVYMFGFGYKHQASQTTWYVKNNVWDTTAPERPYVIRRGYGAAAGKSMRWGTNVVADDDPNAPNYGYGGADTQFYEVMFDSSGGDNEAQAALGDSGGPALVYDDGWKLVGLLLSRQTYAGQPEDTSVFGNQPYIANLTEYRDQFPVESSAVPGDANLDTLVDDDDLSLLLANWGMDAEWGGGNFNADHVVNDDDLSYILANWTAGEPPAGGFVPEPTTAALLTCAAAMWSGRRRRR